MKPSRNKTKSVEITRWKVGDADDFQSMEQEEDYDIESAPPESYEDEVSGKDDIRQLPKPERISRK